MIAHLIKPNGEIAGVMPKNGADFKLEELYKLVECDCVEFVSLYDGRMMIIDENGHSNEKKFNEVATVLYKHGRMSMEETKKAMDEKWGKLGFNVLTIGTDADNVIVGNALVCAKNMVL